MCSAGAPLARCPEPLRGCLHMAEPGTRAGGTCGDLGISKAGSNSVLGGQQHAWGSVVCPGVSGVLGVSGVSRG